MPYINGKYVNWKREIKGLRKIINNAEDSDQGAIDLGRDINRILTSKKYYHLFVDFEYQHFDLDDFCFVLNKEEVNDLLSEFYDYCDENFIWICFDD